MQEKGIYLYTITASTDQAEPKTVQDFLDYIENQELHRVLTTVDSKKHMAHSRKHRKAS